ncbi:ankyrin repeat domain-containing protein [Pseudodesulfovibrio methanolicus]|uniref:Ankyrin repeat domain-containing protein n=1 Tax=Pseudodesulfovibrio methanolicus TaxID=3126690 RepID=A0ABZ2IXU9_9BACT
MRNRLFHAPWYMFLLLLLPLAPVRAQAGAVQAVQPDMPNRPKLRAIAERANDATTTRILVAIEQRDNANIQNSFGQNIIIRLISLKAPDPEDSFRTLAAMGADLNIVDKDHLTPLLYAIGSGDFEATKALLKLGAESEIPGKSPNALHFALSRHCFKEARLLLDSGVNVNVLGPNRDTPLHQACLAAPRELIAHMLALGAMVNAREKTGLTPLHAAAFRGDPAIVKLLLDAGANPEIEDNNGRTAKDWAVAAHHDEAAGLL